jgi:hypothetical protein
MMRRWLGESKYLRLIELVDLGAAHARIIAAGSELFDTCINSDYLEILMHKQPASL